MLRCCCALTWSKIGHSRSFGTTSNPWLYSLLAVNVAADPQAPVAMHAHQPSQPPVQLADPLLRPTPWVGVTVMKADKESSVTRSRQQPPMHPRPKKNGGIKWLSSRYKGVSWHKEFSAWRAVLSYACDGEGTCLHISGS